MLESWIAGYMNKINKTTDSFQNKIWFNLIIKRITKSFPLCMILLMIYLKQEELNLKI